MKKIVLLCTILLVMMWNISLAKADTTEEQVLMKYNDPAEAVTHFDSNEVVTLPTAIAIQKYQLRSVYIDTYNNVDFSLANTQEIFKQEFSTILTNMKTYNMNTIIFNVRPSNDAFYRSDLNPWSEFLTGTQGEDPGWNPLTWMIDEAHKSEITFFASFNAFMISKDSSLTKEELLGTLSANNFAVLHPDYVLSTQTNSLNKTDYYLNPGCPEVRQFVVDSIMEVVSHYPIDGVHLQDDYYPLNSFSDSQDQMEFNSYNNLHFNRDEWRRSNIDDLIKLINYRIYQFNQSNNEAIQFGVSVYGIWDNQTNNLGSKTNDGSSYLNEYANSRLWVKNNSVDFIIPTVNWNFENPYAPYADVIDWWQEVVSGTKVNLYIGQFIDTNYENPSELPNQLSYNQKYSDIKGTVLYNYHQIDNEDSPTYLGLQLLKDQYWTKKALMPATINIDNTPPDSVRRLELHVARNDVTISWSHMDNVQSYIIYRFGQYDEVDLNDTSHIIGLVNNTDVATITFVDQNTIKNNKYIYFISAIDYAFNESMPQSFAIDLSPNDSFTSEMTVLIIAAVLSVGMLSFTSYKVLKNLS